MDWRQKIVGDAFKLENRHPRYYVDIALLFPMLVAAVIIVGSVSAWPPAAWDHYSLKIGLVAFMLCMALAKERWVLLGASFGYCSATAAFNVPFARPVDAAKLLVTAAICGTVCAAVLVFRRNAKPYSTAPTFLDWAMAAAGLAVVVAGLAIILSDASRWWFAHTP